MGLTSVARLSLASGFDPNVHTGHSIKVRARVQSDSGELYVALYEGGSNRSGDLTTGALTTSLADYTVAIDSASVANITSYSDLEIRFWGYTSLGSAVVFEVDYIALVTPTASGGNAGHASATFAAFSATVDTSTTARHASITFVSHQPLASVLGPPTTAYAGHASFSVGASQAGHSDLDTDAASAASTFAAYQPYVATKTSAPLASISVAAYDAIVAFGALASAGHASIVVGASQPARGATAGHASISAGAGTTGKSTSITAGTPSPQFAFSAYDADITSASIVNALAGHAALSVAAMQGSFSIEPMVGHASVSISGYNVTVPSVGATLEVEVYDAVTLDVVVSRYVEVSLDVEVY